MDKPKDDGAAFPRPLSHQGHDIGEWQIINSQEGMPLRDYFAGQALSGLVANPNMLMALGKAASLHNIFENDGVAKMAFSMADSMLAEREKNA